MSPRKHDCFAHSKVVDSRPVTDGRFRRRECLICSRRFATVETSIEEEDQPEQAKLDAKRVQTALDELSKDRKAMQNRLNRMEKNLDFLWPKEK